jgi:hypothetical protein
LLNASAESLYIEDWQSRTPRQILSNTASWILLLESLQLLVDVYPESITTEDNHSLLPINYACLNSAVSVDVPPHFIKL